MRENSNTIDSGRARVRYKEKLRKEGPKSHFKRNSINGIEQEEWDEKG